jgi:hypothetical protein
MRPTSLLKLYLCGLLLAAPVSAEQLPDIIGIARDSTGQTELYQEHYYCEAAASACSVFYLDPAQQLIASKVIDYQLSLQAPSLLFIDYRGDRELAVQGPGTIDDLVIDAGFDNYIRKRWQQLQAGESVFFPFLPADRSQPLAMELTTSDDADCDQTELCLEVSLDSWWLRALVQPIKLSYSRDNQRLLRFRGISNISDPDGNSQTVDISYQYPEQTAGG